MHGLPFQVWPALPAVSVKSFHDGVTPVPPLPRAPAADGGADGGPPVAVCPPAVFAVGAVVGADAVTKAKAFYDGTAVP